MIVARVGEASLDEVFAPPHIASRRLTACLLAADFHQLAKERTRYRSARFGSRALCTQLTVCAEGCILNPIFDQAILLFEVVVIEVLSCRTAISILLGFINKLADGKKASGVSLSLSKVAGNPLALAIPIVFRAAIVFVPHDRVGPLPGILLMNLS